MGMENQPNKPKNEESAGESQIELDPELFFGNKLKLARLALSKSAGQITRELGLKNSSSVLQWERGTSFPSEEKLPTIAKAYGIDLQEIISALRVSKDAREQAKKKSHSSHTGPIRNR